MRQLDIFSFVDVFEWVVISISPTSLIVAIIVLLLKRRLGRSNVRPLHVRTVLYYQNEPVESASPNLNTENRLIRDKAGCRRLADPGEENMRYIDISGDIKRGK